VAGVLGRRPGVRRAEVNPVTQTATVAYDPRHTSVAQLRHWIRECGYPFGGAE
jgi:Cu2+-exporting ATPase